MCLSSFIPSWEYHNHKVKVFLAKKIGIHYQVDPFHHWLLPVFGSLMFTFLPDEIWQVNHCVGVEYQVLKRNVWWCYIHTRYPFGDQLHLLYWEWKVLANKRQGHVNSPGNFIAQHCPLVRLYKSQRTSLIDLRLTFIPT